VIGLDSSLDRKPARSSRSHRLSRRNENPPPQELVRGNKSLSPAWGNTTKLVVALSLVAILAGLVIKFNSLLGPLLLSFITAYLIYPVADTLRRRLKISWRFSVSILYLVLLVIILGLLTWGGITIVDQFGSLISYLQKLVTILPGFIEDITSKPMSIGPLTVDLSKTDISLLTDQILSAIRPLFSRIGSAVGGLATGAVTTVGWIFFVLIFSYFIVTETEGLSNKLFKVQLPGHGNDLNRLGIELAKIWNAFLRGQIIIILITIVIYTAILGGLQLRYFFGMAVIAGLARLVPYVGPWVAWITYGLVSYFQGTTVFGLGSWGYVILIVATGVILDTTLDNFLVPRMMAEALKIHPAAIMVAALMGASLLGIIGVLLAAPVLTSAKLLVDYAMRKLFDQDPWQEINTQPSPPPFRPWVLIRSRISGWWNALHSKTGSEPNARE
jgi:predicted PurR-regulated permease PerM